MKRVGERAALFDPGMKINTDGVRPISSSEAVSVVEESLDGIAVAKRKTYLFDEWEDSSVWDRVKSFLEINQHDVIELRIV